MYNPRGRRGGQGFAIWLLLGQMANFGFSRIPPVTLVTILGQVALHLGFLDKYWAPSIGAVCVSALKVWYQDDWKRLIYATFFHADDWHLYYNMVSMLWKGSSLEQKFGSSYFLCLLAVFSVLVNTVLVALSILADVILGDSSYISQCAVGFSGVLFALKVVKNYSDPPGTEYVMGMIPVPSKIVCWAELVIIHFLVPNSSFIGHLAGILVGLAYALGPLRWIMHSAFSLIPSTAGPSYTYQSGATGWRSFQGQHVGGASNTNSQYRAYTGGLSEEEQLRRAREESLQDYYNAPAYNPSMPQPDHYHQTSTAHAAYNPSTTYPEHVEMDLLRARRLNRFSAT